MSKTIDERVVEMRFDNQQFEKNIQTSMSTLEKLKQKLNLTGASKSLENVNKAAKNVNLNGLGHAVETVHAKFSALQVVGVTTLANITNSAVNAGKKITSALTIDPVKTGFQEYETQINAVQTILANTQSKGKTIKDVNKALDELNTYADQTIYNFTEMTRNIGTFTAAGVDLEKSVTSIKGIANLAAVSGSSSQQASTAMYQLSQALAAGRVSLMDWNSVVNAGMGGQVFQDALKRTAENMGTNVDALIKKYGSFRESLTQGEWLTADVLTETLTQLSGAYTKADLIAQGYNEKQAKDILELAETAKNAATKVKTFTQLWDVLKESAQSGWTQTWELIFGDFEQAKSLFSPLAEFLTGIINGMSEARNKLLEGALASPFGKLAEKIEKVTGATKKMSEVTKDYSDIVNKVINGEFGEGQSRWDKLTKAGYDWAKVQNMVNEKLGNSKRHTEQLTEAQKNQNKTQSTTIEQLVKMSDAQLKSLGFTKDEIGAFRDLEKQSEKTGIPINKLIKDMDQLDGRTLLINSFKNAGSGLVTVIKAIHKAWKNIFPPMTSTQLYNIIAGIHKLSTNLVVSKDTAKKLTRTFKGLFAIVDIIATVTGGALRIAFKVANTILGHFNMNILDVTALIGDAIVKFRDWVDSTLDFTKVFKKIAPYLEDAAEGIREWMKGLKETDNIPKYIIQGLVNGLINGGKLVIDAIITLGTNLLEGIKGVLGIHSPSKEFFEIGQNIIQGLVNGIQNGTSTVWELIKSIGIKCIEIIKNIDFGKVLAAGLAVGMLVTLKKITNVIAMFAAPLEGIGSMFEGIGSMFEGIGAKFKASALEKKSKSLLNMAIAIGVLAASVALLSRIKTNDLIKAGIALTALTAIIVVLMKVSGKMNAVGDFGKQSAAIFGVTAALLIMTIAMKQLASIDEGDVGKVLKSLLVMITGLALILVTFGVFVKADKAGSMDKAGIMFVKMSIAFLLMTTVIKRIRKLKTSDILKGLVVMAAMELLILSVVAVSKLSGEHASKAGGMLLLMSIAFMVMIRVIKQVSKLDDAAIGKGLATVNSLGLIFSAIIAVSKLAGQHGAKAGMMLLLMSGAFAIAVSVVKQASKLDNDAINKGIATISSLGVVFSALILVSKLAGKNAMKAGAMLLMMSSALLIVTGVLFILKEMDPDGLGRALGIVTVLEILFGGLIAVSHLAGDCKGTLITIAVVISLLTVAVIGLTFIDPNKLGTATASLSALMASLGVLVASTGKLQSVKKMIGPLAIMLVVVATLGVIIAALSQLNVGSALGATASLSILLLSMSAAMVIVNKAGKVSMASMGALAVMGLVVGELAVILGLMSHFNVAPSIETAISLSILLVAMSATLGILGAIGAMGPTIFVGIGALAALIAGIGGIVIGLADMVADMSLLTRLGTELSGFMTEAQVFIDGVKNIDAASLGGLTALAQAILDITSGGFLEAIASWITGDSSIGSLGEQLVPFGEAMVAFSDIIAGNIDEGAITAAANMGMLLANLQSAIPKEGGLLQAFTGTQDFSTLTTQLEGYGKAIVAFSSIVSAEGAISQSAIQAAADAGMIMVELQKATVPTNGVTQFFSGTQDFTTLTTQLEGYGNAIVAFSRIVSAEGAISLPAIEAARNAGMIMIELQKATVPTNGVMQFFSGTQDFTTLTTQLEGYGNAIVAFSRIVSVKDAISLPAIEAARNAGMIMIELQKATIPSNGVVQFFSGKQDFSTLITQLEDYGNAIVGFSRIVSVKDAISLPAIEAARNAGLIMTELQGALIPTKGVTQFFSGEQNLAKFGEQVLNFGNAMVAFSSAVDGNIDDGAVTSAYNAGSIMSELQKALPKDGGWFDDSTSLSDFGKELVSFGKRILEYSNKVKDVSADKLLTISKAVKVIVNTINKMTSLNTSGIDIFKEAVEKLSGINFDALVANFSDASDKLSKAGVDIMLKLAEGIQSKQTSVTDITGKVIDGMIKIINSKKLLFGTAGIDIMNIFITSILTQIIRANATITSMCAGMVTDIKNSYHSFYSAGSYLVTGFMNGINDNTYKAKAKARAMASAAAKAAEKELDIHSPSRVFYRIGDYTGQGFINALSDYATKAYKAGSTMADSARSGLNNAITKISNIISGDMDTQPTIRPVIDLSNVESGVGAINGMFNQRLTLGATAEVDTISSMMNNSIQNGGNAEVVSAINKLRKDLGNVGNTSYTISGITYDDGSNISEAVQSLVRAAKMERRM